MQPIMKFVVDSVPAAGDSNFWYSSHGNNLELWPPGGQKSAQTVASFQRTRVATFLTRQKTRISGGLILSVPAAGTLSTGTKLTGTRATI